MNKGILETGPQKFIKENWDTDIMSVILKRPIFPNVSQKELAEQIESRKKCRLKLPTWFHTPNIYYPNKRNIEQTSSEITAEYKARLVDGKSLLDMSGGFGVDSLYFSKKMKSITHCEMDLNLSQITAHNFKLLGVSNIKFLTGDGTAYLKSSHQKFDWIYIDPSRRHDQKGKVFRLEDCSPNIPRNLDLILERTDFILLKTSPLLDVTSAISQLKKVAELHIVAVQNEVKEVLVVLKKETEDFIKIKTVDLRKEGEVHFGFLWDKEKTTEVEYGNPERYLYEPNAAILKAGGFNRVGQHFRLKKLAPHSHLYTSQGQIDFPGRTFAIQQVLPYNKKAMRPLVGAKANITTRNFPETVAQLRKKYKLADGGDDYLFFTTDGEGNRIVIRCKKI